MASVISPTIIRPINQNSLAFPSLNKDKKSLQNLAFYALSTDILMSFLERNCGASQAEKFGNIFLSNFTQKAIENVKNNAFQSFAKTHIYQHLILNNKNAVGTIFYLNPANIKKAIEGLTEEEFKEDLQLSATSGLVTVTRLMLQNPKIEEHIDDLINSLLNASEQGHIEIVQDILSFAHFTKLSLGSALEKASLNGHLSIVRFLLENYAEDIPEGFVDSSLAEAAQNGHKPVIEEILKFKKLSIVSKVQFSIALNYASKINRVDIVEVLLRYLFQCQGQQFESKGKLSIVFAFAWGYYNNSEEILSKLYSIPDVIKKITLENLIRCCQDMGIQNTYKLSYIKEDFTNRKSMNKTKRERSESPTSVCPVKRTKVSSENFLPMQEICPMLGSVDIVEDRDL
jgi:ankyrin repeat protein